VSCAKNYIINYTLDLHEALLAKNGWTNLNDLYAAMCFCVRSCLLGVTMIAPALNFLVVWILLIMI